MNHIKIIIIAIILAVSALLCALFCPRRIEFRTDWKETGPLEWRDAVGNTIRMVGR